MTTNWPGFAPLDPYREAQADVTLLAAGLRSRSEIIASRGRDVADVDNEISADTFKPAVTGRPSPSLLGDS
jgi:capsid protein